MLDSGISIDARAANSFYDRERAKSYIDTYWKNYNPKSHPSPMEVETVRILFHRCCMQEGCPGRMIKTLQTIRKVSTGTASPVRLLKTARTG